MRCSGTNAKENPCKRLVNNQGDLCPYCDSTKSPRNTLKPQTDAERCTHKYKNGNRCGRRIASKIAPQGKTCVWHGHGAVLSHFRRGRKRYLNGAYARFLENSKVLIDRYNNVREAPNLISLTDEVALAKTILGEMGAIVAKVHARNGSVSGDALGMIMSMLKDVTHIVDKASQIDERKKNMVTIEEMMAFTVSLKSALDVALTNAGMVDAIDVIAEPIAIAPWPGDHITPGDAKRFMKGPVQYEVEFSQIRRKDELEVVDAETTDDDSSDSDRDLSRDSNSGSPTPVNGSGNGVSHSKMNGVAQRLDILDEELDDTDMWDDFGPEETE